MAAAPRSSAVSDALAVVRGREIGEGHHGPLTVSRGDLGRLSREGELAALRTAFEAGARWLTLTGPAGVGKTHIARSFSSAAAPRLACFVDARALATAEEINAAVADALEITRDPSGDLGSAIRARGSLLIVLDHFEPGDAAAREVFLPWITSSDVLVVVTAREALSMPGEIDVPIAPLTQDDAVTLFVRGAVRARASFLDHGPVSELVQRLDRLPLAIELASAWCDALSVETILEQLGSLALLEPMAAAIESSFSMLTDSQRQLLLQCSVFQGAFTVDQVDGVLGADTGHPRALATLVRKSLLEVSFDREPPRYRLLSIVRAFAVRKLDAAEARRVGRRHAEVFAARGGSDAGDLPDLLAAHDATDDPNLRARLALAADPILYDRGPFDRHLAILDRAVRSADGALLAELLHARARSSRVRGLLAEACEDLERARPLAGPPLRARVLRMMGVIARHRERTEEAVALLTAAIELASEAADAGTRLRATDDLGIVALDQYDLPGAERCFRLVLGLSRKLGDVRYQAIAEQHLGLRFHLGDEPSIAERHYQEALRLHRAARDLRFEGWALGMSAYLSLENGRPEQAEAYASEALALYRSIGDPRTRAFLLVPQICALQARGRASDARLRLLEARQGLDPDEDRAMLRALDCVDSERAGAIDASSGPVELQLTARVARTPRARAPTRMATDGSWFEAPGQPRVSLHRRRALRSLLAILVQHRQRAPGQGLLWEALLSAGWPGERVLASAGARRVYVAISSLRQMGLATTLLRMDDGYRLDESVILVPPSKV